MKTIYSSGEISGIFLQAVDQHYENIKDDYTKLLAQKEKLSEEELSEKHFLNNNFDFLNDSTDIDSSTFDEDGSRKNSSDLSLENHQKSKSEPITKKSTQTTKLSTSFTLNYSTKIKQQKEKIFAQLKEFLSNSNYLQINNLSSLNNVSNVTNLNSQNSLSNFYPMYYNYSSFSGNDQPNYINMNYNNARSRCNSYPYSNLESGTTPEDVSQIRSKLLNPSSNYNSSNCINPNIKN